MNSQFLGSLKQRLNRDGCPITLSMMITAFVLFVAGNLTEGMTSWIVRWLVFDPAHWLSRPWTLLTSSLICLDVWACLFGLIWLYFVGGSLERSLGARTFLGLWGASSAVVGLSLVVCNLLTGRSGTVTLMVVLLALTVAWAMMNRGAVINLWGVLPLSATALAVLSCVFTVVTYHLPAGIFALSGSLLCWAFVRYRWFLRSGSRRVRPGYGTVTRISGRGTDPARRSLNPVERFRSWRNARRFEKLLRDAEVDERTKGH